MVGDNDVDHDHPEPEPSPVWDDVSSLAARAAASSAVAAFNRPLLDEATWWAELSPRLSDSARTAYVGTDPANIPPSTVTGDPVVTDTSSGYLATVEQPTDVGTYVVVLARAGQDEPWLVERLTLTVEQP